MIKLRAGCYDLGRTERYSICTSLGVHAQYCFSLLCLSTYSIRKFTGLWSVFLENFGHFLLVSTSVRVVHNPQQEGKPMLATRSPAVLDVASCSVPWLPLPTEDASRTGANVLGGPKAMLADTHPCKWQTDRCLESRRELREAEGKI